MVNTSSIKLVCLGTILLVLSIQSDLVESAGSCYSCKCSRKYSRKLNRWMNSANCQYRHMSDFPDYLPVSLTDIDVSHNPISMDSLDAIEQYTNLLSLSLKHCRLNAIPDDTFKNLTSLRLLELTGNILLHIHGPTFNGLSSLRYLKGLASTYIEEDTFTKLQQLRELDLTLHQVKPRGNLFYGLQIKQLALNFTSATTVPETIFHVANHSLQEVAISGQKLTVLPDNLFYGLVMLRKVSIDAPNLDAIPESSFKGLYGYVQFSKLGERLVDSAPLNLASISLSGMSIVPPGLFQYQQSVETLKMSDIDNIPSDVFAHLQTLNSLHLSGCTLLEVPQLHNLIGLKSLNMSNTNLQAIQPDILSGLHSLTSLDLSYNNITYIPAGIFKDVGITLMHLNVSDNNLEGLDSYAFENVLALKTLDLSNNKISKLSPFQFMSLHNLQVLDLSKNLIESLPELLFFRQEDLVMVNLSSNRLREIPDSLLDNMLALRFLDISQNKLALLPPDVMQAFDLLAFDDNPIYCDCNLYLMLVRNRKSIITGRCDSPVDLAGTLLRKLNMSDVCIIDTTTTETTVPTSPQNPTIPISTTEKQLAIPSTTLQTTTRFTITEIDISGEKSYIYKSAKSLAPFKQYTKSKLFIACMSLLSLVVSVTVIAVTLKCVRTLMRSRVYEVNACQ